MSVRPKDSVLTAYHTMHVCIWLWEWFGNILQFDEAMKDYFTHVTFNIAFVFVLQAHLIEYL